MNQSSLDTLRLELSIKAKNGLDFILAAIITWSLITVVWTLDFSSYDKSVLTFIVGSLLMPLAILSSKLIKTQWKVKDNPLDPLGLWLNFAQLFYFPFLIFVLLKEPDYFLMTYVIITGAHFFPYSWYYKELGFAIMAGIISVGAFLIALNSSLQNQYYVGIFMVVSLMILATWIFLSFKKKSIFWENKIA